MVKTEKSFTRKPSNPESKITCYLKPPSSDLLDPRHPILVLAISKISAFRLFQQLQSHSPHRPRLESDRIEPLPAGYLRVHPHFPIKDLS